MSSNKTKDVKPEPVAYSEAALRNNAAVVEYCRTSMAALSGSTAGNFNYSKLKLLKIVIIPCPRYILLNNPYSFKV